MIAPDTDDLDLESLFAYSHNLRLSAYLKVQVDEAEAEHDAALTHLDSRHQEVLAGLERRREDEIAAVKQNFAAVTAAFAQGFLASRQSTSTEPAPVVHLTLQRSVLSQECSSDYSCNFGSVCVKQNYSAAGYCARAVNAAGVPTLEGPSSESVFVKMPSVTDCRTDGQCPVAFACDRRAGACIRSR